jgi:predicted Zn finger-like uncharacterized protein
LFFSVLVKAMQAGAAATLRFIDTEVNYKCLDIPSIVVTTGPKDRNSWLDSETMRLICPNCGAQYEVADDAISAAGRDVQCSNCGHGWFQHAHTPEPEVETASEIAAPEVVAEEAQPESETAEAPAAVEIAVDVQPDPSFPEDDEEPEPALADTAASAPLKSTLDDNLLAVLREEAEREVAQRRAEAARGVETQPELGIEAAGAFEPPGSTPKATTARDEYSHLSSDADLDAIVPTASVRPAARRDLLPNVEEISSTLRSSNGGRDDDDNPMPDLPPIKRSGGFRSGFLLSVLLAVFIVVAYVLAPRLAEQFPAAKGALDAFVMAVDVFRTWVRAIVASLTGMLEGQS